MWLQLLRPQQIEKSGVSRIYHPGDWVDVGGQTARRWIADGVARSAIPFSLDNSLSGCGVALFGDAGRAGLLTSKIPKLAVAPMDALQLPYARTLVWETTFPARPELVPIGLRLLETWEVAAPIVSYDQLAAHIGSEAARARTQVVVRDLRVPVYEPRFIFIRRCRAGQALIDAWAQERASGDDDKLCLLRALYRVKPLLCALPTTWMKQAA